MVNTVGLDPAVPHPTVPEQHTSDAIGSPSVGAVTELGALQEVTDLGAGELIGELSFYAGGSATATVRAATDVELIVIPRNQFVVRPLGFEP